MPEQLALICLVDADATVFYGNSEFEMRIVALLCPARFAHDADIAIFRKFDGIADEIRDDLPQPNRIATNYVRYIVRNHVAQGEILALCLSRE